MSAPSPLAYAGSGGADVHRSLCVPVLLMLPLLAACEQQTPPPRVHAVSPATISPGGLVLISGSDFRQDSVVLINGRPAARVTWVNASLLAARMPSDLGDGIYNVAVAAPFEQRAEGNAAAHQPVMVQTPPPVVTRPPPDPEATRPRVTVTVPPRASNGD